MRNMNASLAIQIVVAVIAVWNDWPVYAIAVFFYVESLALLVSHTVFMYKLGKTHPLGIFMAVLFALHFSFFHFVLGIFLSVIPYISGILTGLELPGMHEVSSLQYAAALIFGVVALLTGLLRKQNTKNIDVGVAMFVPYARLIPLYLLILGAVFFANSRIILIPFIIGKIGASFVVDRWYEKKVYGQTS